MREDACDDEDETSQKQEEEEEEGLLSGQKKCAYRQFFMFKLR